MESDLDGPGDLANYFFCSVGGRNPSSSGNTKGDSHVNK